MLYITESRTVPSLRMVWCRSTPSFFAPSASIARWDAEVEIVGAQADHLASERVERVPQQEQLASGIDMRPLRALPVPGMTDLDAVDRAHDVVVAGRPDDRAGCLVAHHPRQHVTGPLPLERIADVAAHAARQRHGGVPQLPQPSVGCRGFETVVVSLAERLQSNTAALEHYWLDVNHAGQFNCQIPTAKFQLVVGGWELEVGVA